MAFLFAEDFFSILPDEAKKLDQCIREAGFECYFVGGCVRDHFLKRKFSDFDIATNAKPHQIEGLFKRVVSTGIKHGTVTVLEKEMAFEVTTFRRDGDLFR